MESSSKQQLKASYDSNFKGLVNAGANNCFLNVVIQSLWHLQSFRINFLQDKTHRHSDKELFLRKKRSEILSKNLEAQGKTLLQASGFYSDDILENKSKGGQMQASKGKQRRSSFDQKMDAAHKLLLKEVKSPVDKEYVKKVRQSEVCLFCNLYDLFTKYEFIEDNILQPKNVRESLQQIYDGQSDFSYGRMGCAQETLQDILCYLHREYLSPNYLEEYLLMNPDGKFVIDNSLDDTGCSPKCSSHLTFGLDVCEISSCRHCKQVDSVSNIKREFVHQLYAMELIQTKQQYSLKKLSHILEKIIEGEADFHLQYQSSQHCSTCGQPMKAQQRWLLDLPNVYTLGISYMDSEASRDELQAIYELIPPKLMLAEFLRVGVEHQESTQYVLRGMITYYGRHYTAYFYSDRFDSWMQFDDEHVKALGNFSQVVKKGVAGKLQPTTIFYEKESIIKNIKIDSGSKDKLYCTERGMKTTNFWTSSGETNCAVFQGI